jgi:hypothetical protein
MQEMHNTLGTMVVVADILKIDVEQQDCLYKLEVMTGIRTVVMQPLPTPTPTTGTSVPPPLPCTPSPQPAVWLEPLARGRRRRNGRLCEGHLLRVRAPTYVAICFPRRRHHRHMRA